MKIGYQSLRKISKYFEIFLGIRVSHQTIKNWSNKNHKETINNEEFEYSGYYVYDEQFLRLNGVKHYRLTLFDAILNVPVSERIVRRRIPKNTKKFILDSTKNKPFICNVSQCSRCNRSKSSIMHISFILTNKSQIKSLLQKKQD